MGDAEQFYVALNLRHWADMRACGWPVTVENKHEVGFLAVYDEYDAAKLANPESPIMAVQKIAAPKDNQDAKASGGDE